MKGYFQFEKKQQLIFKKSKVKYDHFYEKKNDDNPRHLSFPKFVHLIPVLMAIKKLRSDYLPYFS